MIGPTPAVQPNTASQEIANPPTPPLSPKNFCKILGGLALSSLPILFGVFANCVVATRNTNPALSQCLGDKMPIGFALGWSALGIIKVAVDRRFSQVAGQDGSQNNLAIDTSIHPASAEAVQAQSPRSRSIDV